MPIVVLFLATSLIWGSTWFAITGQLGTVAPAVSITYRFGLAVLLLMVWCLIRGENLRFSWRQHLGMLAQGAMLFCINYISIYYAEQYVSSGLVAVVFSTLAFLNVMADRYLYGSPIRPSVALASLLGIGGVVLMFLPEMSKLEASSMMLIGVGAAAVGTFSASGGNMMAIYNQRSIPVVSCSAWGMVYGTLLCAAAAGVTGAEWNFDWRPTYIISLLYLALFGTVFAFLGYLTLLLKAGTGKASYVNVVTPVIALLLSTFFEGYHWSLLAVIGLGLVLVGNVLLIRR